MQKKSFYRSVNGIFGKVGRIASEEGSGTTPHYLHPPSAYLSSCMVLRSVH